MQQQQQEEEEKGCNDLFCKKQIYNLPNYANKLIELENRLNVKKKYRKSIRNQNDVNKLQDEINQLKQCKHALKNIYLTKEACTKRKGQKKPSSIYDRFFKNNNNNNNNKNRHRNYALDPHRVKRTFKNPHPWITFMQNYMLLKKKINPSMKYFKSLNEASNPYQHVQPACKNKKDIDAIFHGKKHVSEITPNILQNWACTSGK